MTAMTAFSDARRTDYSDPADTPQTYPDWYVRTTTYPNGTAITSSRFGFNFREVYAGTSTYCAARWGWASNENAGTGAPGSHDSCGGAGGYGGGYGSTWMSSSKNSWQPAVVYVWVR